jgi:hypothetical protein
MWGLLKGPIGGIALMAMIAVVFRMLVFSKVGLIDDRLEGGSIPALAEDENHLIASVMWSSSKNTS